MEISNEQIIHEVAELRSENANLCRRLEALEDAVADFAQTNAAFRLALARAHGATATPPFFRPATPGAARPVGALYEGLES